MSNRDTELDVETLLKVVAATQGNQQPKEDVVTNKLPLIVAIFPMIIALGSLFYYTGVQKEELSGGIKEGKLELKADFIEKLSDHKDSTNSLIQRIQNDLRDVQQKNNEMRGAVSRVEKEVQDLEDKNRALQGTVDDQYRQLTYLRSQHNVNIPRN